jgi:hypothetical protein
MILISLKEYQMKYMIGQEVLYRGHMHVVIHYNVGNRLYCIRPKNDGEPICGEFVTVSESDIKTEFEHLRDEEREFDARMDLADLYE